jgi:type IV pilus secretin PilQ/predicted competence protein
MNIKRKIYWHLFASLSLLVLLFGFAYNNEAFININRVLIQPGTLSAKVVLETDASLSIQDTYYDLQSNPTLVINLDRIKTIQEPKVPAEESQLIKDVKVEKTGMNQFRFSLHLSERVPYRIISRQSQTVVELNKIQRAQGDYVIEPDIQQQLNQKPKSEIFLDKIDISEKTDRVNVSAKLSDQVLSNVFALEKPYRLVVDLFDTFCSGSSSVYQVDKLGLAKVRVAQFQMSNPHPITRMVFDLKEPGFYSLNSDKNELLVSFFKGRTSTPAAAPALKETVSASSSAPSPQKLNTDPPKNQVLEKPKAEKLDEAVKPQPVSPLVVPAPVETKIKAEPKNTSTSQPADPANFQVEETKQAQSQQGQEEKFKPKTILATEEKYTGEILSLKFKDADLRDVLLYLGEFAHLNVIFDPEVRGTVTCDLVDLPWDQALDILLKNNKLGKTIEGNVLRIAPISVLTQEDEQLRKLRESKELSGPLQVKTITLSYSKAKDLQGLLQTKKSARGEIIIDERTNTLIISDVKEKLDLLERLISVLDTPTPQVSIEARIVEASSTFIRNLGIQWGFKGLADPFYGNQTSLQFPNKINVNGAMIPQGIVTEGIGGPLGGYAINLPAPAFSTVLGLSFANVLDTFRLDMAISALETSGQGRIISCPKVTTQNNQEADIVQGRQIPVQTVANFTVTTRYVNAALELKATPQITAEGTIIMTIDIKNDAADFANLVNGIPPITTQSAKTTVMVVDGGTTVIGGIYRIEDSITREKVPLLYKIPILGNLFRSFARTKTNRELLIFITPRIIK